MPFTAKTRVGTLRESDQNRNLKMISALLTVTTNGGEWRGADSDTKEWQRLREVRHLIRPTISFYLLEGIERMRGAIFGTVAGNAYYGMVAQYALYDTADDFKLDLEELPHPPDCAFDKSFGYPCSEAQLTRIRKANESGKVLDHY
jgi:hypothetical protein